MYSQQELNNPAGIYYTPEPTHTRPTGSPVKRASTRLSATAQLPRAMSHNPVGPPSPLGKVSNNLHSPVCPPQASGRKSSPAEPPSSPGEKFNNLLNPVHLPQIPGYSSCSAKPGHQLSNTQTSDNPPQVSESKTKSSLHPVPAKTEDFKSLEPISQPQASGTNENSSPLASEPTQASAMESNIISPNESIKAALVREILMKSPDYKSLDAKAVSRIIELVSEMPSHNPNSAQDLTTDTIKLVADEGINDNESSVHCHRIYRIGPVDVPALKTVPKVPQGAKPPGTGYVKARLRLSNLPEVDTFICVDTGADFSVCTSQFIIHHFGEQAIYKLQKPSPIQPKLKSATGHSLNTLGTVVLQITMGTYSFSFRVLVYKHSAVTFLMGNDCVYDRLICNQGKFISFAEKGHKPVPILYFLPHEYARTVKFCSIAPNSSSLVPIRVSEPHGLPGQNVLISPIEGSIDSYDTGYEHLIDTVSTVQPNGVAYAWVENNTEDYLKILPNTTIAQVSQVTDMVDSVLFGDMPSEAVINRIDSADIPTADSQTNESWALSAAQALKDQLPITVKVNWDFLMGHANAKRPNFVSEEDPPSEDSHGNVNFIHNKADRAELLDGTGVEFPIPSSHELSDLPTDPDNTKWIDDIDRSHLSDMQWTFLKALILRKAQAFARHKNEIGCYNGFKASLPLKPGTGYLYSKPRTLNEKHRALADEHVKELLEQGIIRPSKSPHATNVVIVSKKGAPGQPPKSRMCVDLREVNQHSVPSRFPNLSLEDSLTKIQGAKFRSSFDFNAAFHQIVLDEDSIPVTAFYVNGKLYEYVRLVFGHAQSMQIFCSLMALLCTGYPPACYYADDLLITTPSDPQKSTDELFMQHLNDIEGMLDRIIEAGLKLSAHKCQWAYDSSRPMEWLGFTLADNLLKPQEAKVKSVRSFPRPTTAKQALSFVSLASFYRRFIKNFAKIAQPLYEVGKLDKKEPFIWTESAEIAFNELKDALCSTDAVLRLPRVQDPFVLHTDASWGCLGGVLSQKDPVDGKLHPCAYGSRKFNEQETRYSTPLKELMSILYCLNLWSGYLHGQKILLFSDCRAWTFLKAQINSSNKVSRHALQIQEYDVEVCYLPGPKNKAADGLSRMYDTGDVRCDNILANRDPLFELLGAPQLPPDQPVSKDLYLELCEVYLTTIWPKLVEKYNERLAELGEPPLRAAQIYECSIDDLGPEDEFPDPSYEIWEGSPFKNISNYGHFGEFQHPYLKLSCNMCGDLTEAVDSTGDPTNYLDEQDFDSHVPTADGEIRFITINDNIFSIDAFSELQLGDEFCLEKFQGVKNKVPDVINSGYFVKKRILMRKMSSKEGHQFDVVCVPRALVKALLDSTHGSLLVGHFGSQRYLLNMRRKYFWPGMQQDILEFHKNCIPCQLNDKYPVKIKAGQTLRPQYPNSIVFIDLVTGLNKSLDGHYCMLMIYCGFSRFSTAIPLKSEKADYVVRQFMDHYVARYGMPTHIHSDNGRNVDSSLIRHLCLMLGCVKTSTPPYNARSNWAECICGAVVQLIRKGLVSSDQRYWPQSLPFILNAYNSTVHTATGYTPNALFLGRFSEPSPVPLVPFDCEAANVTEYYKKLRRFQELSFEIVRARNERLSKARKAQMDKNAITPKYAIGDYVLVKNLQPGLAPGQVKLRTKYLGPFRIIKVYTTSLALVPWSLNSRLEEFYRDPNLFRLAHRGDVPTFQIRIAAMKDCKPYKGPTENQLIVDPIMVARFLDQLDLDTEKDLVAIIDPDEPPQAPSNNERPDSHSALADASSIPQRPSDISDVSAYMTARASNSVSTNSPFDSGSPLDSDDDSDGPPKPALFIPDPRQLSDGNSPIQSPVPSDAPEGSGFESADGDDESSPEMSRANSFDSLAYLRQGERLFSSDSADSIEFDPEFADAMNKFYSEAANRFKHLKKVEQECDEIAEELAVTKRLIELAQGSKPTFDELQQLMKSPDPHVRNKAVAEFRERLDELEAESVEAARDGYNPITSTPKYKQQRAFNPDLARDTLVYQCAKGIEKMKDRLSLSGPLPDSVRKRVLRSVKKAQLKLKETKRKIGISSTSNSGSTKNSSSLSLSGLSKTSSGPDDSEIESHYEWGSDEAAKATLASSGDASGSNPELKRAEPARAGEDIEWDHYEDPPPRPRVIEGPQPDNFFNSAERPYAGPADAIRRWMDDGEEAKDKPIGDTPKVTRYGRQVKPRNIFDPADEAEREKQLRAQAREEAQKKLAEKLIQKDEQAARNEPEPSGSQVKRSPHIARRAAIFEGKKSDHAEVRRSPRIAAQVEAEKSKSKVSPKAPAPAPTQVGSPGKPRAPTPKSSSSSEDPGPKSKAGPSHKTKSSKINKIDEDMAKRQGWS